MQSSSAEAPIQDKRTIEPRSAVRLPDWAIAALTLLTIVIVWEVAVRADLLNDFRFPPPSKLAAAFADLTTQGFPRGVTVFSHVTATLQRILKGYILATLLAIPIGLFIGSREFLDRATSPIITFARSVASISLLPLTVAWFGVGEVSRVFLITYACFWVILTAVIHGYKSVDPVLVRAAQTLGASERQIFYRVMLPASLPRIFAGMKIALGLAFLVIVAVEMIGTIQGLGALVMEARTFYRTDMTMVGMLIIALFGFMMAKGLDWLERTLLPWSSELEGVER